MVKHRPANSGDAGFIPGSVGKIPQRRKWQCTPVFLPRKSHGQRSLEGHSPWGCKTGGHDLVTKRPQRTGSTVNVLQNYSFNRVFPKK